MPMRMRVLQPIVAIALAAILLGPAAPARAIPPHPEALTFPPLDFEPPVASEFRRELPNGVPVYLAPSHEFPLVTITFTFKGGTYLEEPGEAGLGSTLGSLMRRGGTMTVPAEELDEKFDFLAANVSTYVAQESSGASINCLRSNLDEAFALFMDLVRHPGFDAKRLRVHKDQVIEELRQRNDAPMSVAMINMPELVFGKDHFSARQPTKMSIDAITPERLRALHARIFHPGNLIVAATGDFEPSELVDRLAGAMQGWERGETAADPPAPDHRHEPGLYHADVAQEDLPQGTTLIVTRSIRRDDPDAVPLMVMNHILGGGGFTSRITNRVRSDEGLAYAASSFVQPAVHYPGVFGAFFQSKNRTVALATKIIFEEIDRIRTEPVTDEELATAKNSYIEQFPQRFSSKRAVLNVLVNDEMTDRDPNYWHTYRDRVRAVSKDDVTKVAREYLDPSGMLVLVVGDWEEIYGGDLEGRATMNDFFDGDVKHLPTRDPLTLEVVK